MILNKIFSAARVFGLVILGITYVALAATDSPYTYPRPYGLWAIVQLASVALLIFSANFGMAAMSTSDKAHVHPLTAMISVAFTMGMVGVAIVTVSLREPSALVPTVVDVVVLWVARGVAVIALVAGALAIYVNNWVYHRR